MTPTPTQTLTMTPTLTQTLTMTPTQSMLPTESPREDNDFCEKANELSVDGIPYTYTFSGSVDPDWIAFTAPKDGDYMIGATVSHESPADVTLAYYTACNTEAVDIWDASFTPSAYIQIREIKEGERVYIKYQNIGTSVRSDLDYTYNISVRSLSTEPPIGPVMIVHGEDLEATADKVRRFFEDKGVSSDHIKVIDERSRLGDSNRWLKKRVSAEKTFMLYIIGQGADDTASIASRIKIWQNDDLKDVNVVVIRYGSNADELIQQMLINSRAQNNSQEQDFSDSSNRLIMTMNATMSASGISENRIDSSDVLIRQLYTGDNLYDAFNYVASKFPNQLVQLDSDENGIANEPNDVVMTTQLHFEYADSVMLWPPSIASVPTTTTMESQGKKIQVAVYDDTGVTRVYADVYDLDGRVVEQIDFTPSSVVNTYEIVYNKVGQYRFVITAEDQDGLLSDEHEIIFSLYQLFLPVISR